MRPLMLILALGLGMVGACSLLDDDPPDDSCMVDRDCFRAQGERCDLKSHTCTAVDAGVDAP